MHAIVFNLTVAGLLFSSGAYAQQGVKQQKSPSSTAAQQQKTCATLGFTVNDFGKDEPARQATVFLGRLIAETMDKHYIKGWVAGTPKITCTFFTKFMGFDEYTCKAESEVCWPGTRDPFAKKTPAKKAE